MTNLTEFSMDKVRNERCVLKGSMDIVFCSPFSSLVSSSCLYFLLC